jgi:predicted RNA methylase
MESIQRLSYSIRHLGLRASFLKIYLLLIDLFFDRKYGTHTTTPMKIKNLTIKSDNRNRGITYQATRVIPLKKMFCKMKSALPANSVFVDLGCGKGRTLLIASQFGLKKAVGVEFAHELCETAKKNCAVYKAKTAILTEFQIIEADVVNYHIKTNENIFFMFNPFDDVILGKVLDNISSSLKTAYRKTLIIYCNPKYGNLIEKCDNFFKSAEFVFMGYTFAVYSSILT